MIVRDFLQRLSGVKVLDPACGSGNFLYVTLQKLKDLEKEVIVYAMDHDLGGYLPMVGPWQLHGIEVNPYAFELAQMTVWIGYLQWTRANGFGAPQDPVLRPMDTFHRMDAILDLSDPENPREPEWPSVDYIVGNPPFLGVRFLRRELGDAYVDKLFALYGNRIPNASELCCYWFEKARAAIEAGRCARAGLLATQGIRGGANREVLNRIKRTGDIFFAESDREWVLDGATVHVSMVAFDGGVEDERTLDGERVEVINPNLSARADVTQAKVLPSNRGRSFMGDTKGGPFDIEDHEALALLLEPNPNRRPTSDVLVPWINGRDLTQRPRQMWVIDFGCDADEEEAARYEAAFALVLARVRPQREQSRSTISEWWRHERPRKDMRDALRRHERYVATPRVTKHRLFVTVDSVVLPDSQIIAFADGDDELLGLLQSFPHEAWARAQGSQLRERESGFRYTPTTCFETFPFPDASESQREAISAAARELDRLRETWLNPPEWTRQEVLEFPGAVDGPWSRWVEEPDDRGIGTVRWPRTVPRDDDCAQKLKRRTLTNLYNERPAWLELAHRRLDEAVLEGYGWSGAMGPNDVLDRLLEYSLNCPRSIGQPADLH